MAKLPSRLRRLDEILYDLPVDEPMLLTELDGYLVGIAVSPEPILPAEWLPPIWGGLYGEEPPFEDPIDVQMFADMVLARYAEIVRDLGRGKFQPFFDIDDRNGDILWEMWIEGLALAIGLRPESWSALIEADGPVATAASAMLLLVAITAEDTPLTSIEINTICDEAPAWIPGYVAALYAARARSADAPSQAVMRTAKVGRNDPCPCGSGRKHKRCCAAA